MPLRPPIASLGGWIDAVGHRDEFAGLVGQQPDRPPGHFDDEQPHAQIAGGPLEPEPDAQVDDRHDLAARKHHALHERRRIGHRGHLLDHLHVPDLMTLQGVGRAGDGEQDIGP